MPDSQSPQDGEDFSRTLGFDELPDDRRSSIGERPRTIEVEVLGGPMDGLRGFVEGPVVTIGRSEDSDVSLALDATVSHRHARIVREQDHFWLEDLGSRNGTYLGDKRVRERTLIGPGTLFRIGRTRLEFMTR